MFSRPERLPRAAFPFVIARGRRLSSTHFTAVLSEEVTGYAVVVPKKIARLSTTRHRLKRQVLEALRTLPLPKALILFPKSSASSLGHQDIQKELTALLSKIRH